MLSGLREEDPLERDLSEDNAFWYACSMGIPFGHIWCKMALWHYYLGNVLYVPSC